MAQLYQSGRDVDIRPYITKGELRQILEVLEKLEEPYKLREVFEALDGSLEYHKIRLAISYLQRQERVAS